MDIKKIVARKSGTLVERAGRPWANCALCGISLPISDLVLVGSRQDSQLKCRSCVRAEHQREHPKLRGRTLEEQEQSRQKRQRWFDRWLEQRRRDRERPVYDSIPVLDAKGKVIGVTSFRRIRLLERDGHVRTVERDPTGRPAKVQLAVDKALAPRELIKFENRCIACDGTDFLKHWRFLPSWHPVGRNVRRTKTSAALCSRCYSAINGRTWALFRAIAGPPRMAPEASELVRRRSLLLEALFKIRRAIPLSESMVKQIERSTGLEIWRQLRDAGGAGSEKELLRHAQEIRQKLDSMSNEQERVRQRVIDSKIDLEATFQMWIRDLAEESR